MDKTIEEILLEQLEQPVRLKNGSVAENPRTGFLVSERAEKVRERAEKEEREKRAIVWQLSDREKAIVKSLG